MAKQKLYYAVVTIGAAVGLLASFGQMLEKITLLKNSDAVLSCNLNSVFNCSNVLNAWQSSVFGFPNTLLCIIFFSLVLAAGLIGWTGGAINAKLRFFFQFLALFFAGFGFWYFWQSIFVVGVLCIYCIFCYGGVLAINAALFRLNYKDYPLSKKAAARLEAWVARGADIFFWCLIALVIALEAIINFA